jgi:hypothetical protein|tara:strand:+ start:14957 stop:15907 length:951 start_codon:yes stop_codon:yes gene_type:complete
MSTFIVFPDDTSNYMPINDMIKPAEVFSKLGCFILTEKNFFTKEVLDSVKPDDNVMLYFKIKDDAFVEVFKNLECNKFLRNGDPCKSDGILFKNDLELHEKVNFDCIFISVPSKTNMKFLKDKNINALPFTQCLDFSNQRSPETVFDIKNQEAVITGQLHSEFYPVRQRIAEYWFKNTKKFSSSILSHPGFELDSLSHNLIGDNYVDFLSHFWVMGVGTGHANGLHCKFLECAKSYTLPLGNVPTYMHPRAQELVLQVGIDESDEEMDRQITELLSDKNALKNRILEYSSIIKQEYNLQHVVGNVFRAMQEKQYLK